ncbi:MAG: SDR family oxidoreductase [Wenzhouxiangellaceae bacterium]
MSSSSQSQPGDHLTKLGRLWQLDGHIALVTGGSRGIGYAVAEQLLSFGATVIICARGEMDLHSARDRLREQYGSDRVHGIAADLSEADGRDIVAAHVHDDYGRLNILINNVGTNIRKPALDYSEGEYHHILQTNLDSTFELSLALHPLLATAAPASVVNVTSVAGLTHLRTGAPYAISKAAMIQLTRNLAVEWAADGIRVNAVAPWYINTPLAQQVLSDPDYRRQVLDRTPLERVGEPWEAAAAIAFFTLPAAGFITGQTLAVDGGFTQFGF